MEYILFAINECEEVGIDYVEIRKRTKKDILKQEYINYIRKDIIFSYYTDNGEDFFKEYISNVRRLAEDFYMNKEEHLKKLKAIDKAHYDALENMIIKFESCIFVDDFVDLVREARVDYLVAFLNILYLDFEKVYENFKIVEKSLEEEKEFLTYSEYQNVLYEELVYNLS